MHRSDDAKLRAFVKANEYAIGEPALPSAARASS